MESRKGDHIRLGSLDALRGVAILLVILFHTAGHFPVCAPRNAVVELVENQGVQLFFLVSAFAMSVIWQARAGENRLALKFYIRRVCRIAPLYWLAIVAYFEMFGRFAPGIALAANATFLHGLVPGAINNVVPGGWSIGVEMVFYAVFRLIALVPPRWLLAVGLACRVHPAAGVRVRHVCLLPPALARHRRAAGECRGRRRVARGGARVPALRTTRSAGVLSGLATMAAVMWLVLRLNLTAAPLQLFGRLSYSMYLAHYAVIVLLAAVMPWLWYPAAVVVVTALTGALSYVSFRTLENWSQQLGRRLVGMLARR